MKKTAILATAIAAVFATGVASADAGAYGKVRLSIDLGSETQAGAKDQGVNNNSSRFGFKGTEDLGNGMSAIYRIEVGYNADSQFKSATSNRLGYAGVKGDFGTFQVGQQWTPSYLLVRGKHDPFDSVGGNVMTGGFAAPFRVNDAIAYINKFGDVSLAAALVASNDGATDFEDEILNDHTDIAVSIPVGPVTVGIALFTSVDDEQQNGTPAAPVDSTSPSAVNIGYADGPLSADLGIFMTDNGTDDEDWTAITVGYNVGSGKVTAQFEDNGVDDQFNLGYSHKLSKKSSLFAEISSGDIATEETNVGIHVNF